MSSPELRALWKEVDELNKQAYETPASNWEEYQKRLGIFQGFRQAIDIIIDLQNNEASNF
jgi:hypothetical protein